MKTVKNMFWAVPAVAMALCMSVVSCTSDEVMENPVEQPAEEERVPNRTTMNLQGGLVPFDATTTRATAEEWPDGAKVYLQFTVGTSLIDGMATYDTETASWTVDYYGELTSGKEAKCEAYYFENTGTADHLGVALTEHSVIYADKSAVYMFEDNTLTVIASLTPMTGRIRFKGEAAETYVFTGIKNYTGYDIRTNTFTVEQKEYNGTVPTDGYTPYYYGYFVNESKKTISFDDNRNNMTYAKTLSANALAVGRSGSLDIPTLNDRSGWTVVTGEDFTVSGVKFRMVKVHKGTFSMGSTENSNEKPVHSVTFTESYLIGETEVTQELWLAVMGENPSFFTGDKKPVERVSWEDCQKFILKLNAKTGRKFRLPTEAEWEFAARMGDSKNIYPWSGNDAADDKDCFYANFKPGDGDYVRDGHLITARVGTYTPNDFGLYDLAGNVSEWTSTSYNEALSRITSDMNPEYKYNAAKEDPYRMKRKIVRGGSWKDVSHYVRSDLRMWEYQNEQRSYIGFRCVRTQVGFAKGRSK